MSKITLRSFRVADRVKKLGTDYAPIRAIPGKPLSAWREGRVGGAMIGYWQIAHFAALRNLVALRSASPPSNRILGWRVGGHSAVATL